MSKQVVNCLSFESRKAPLVVVFTKRDGAVGKATRCIVDKSSASDRTVSRAMKKEARARAEIQVVQHVKEREEELRQLSQTNSCMVFLTTSGMVTWLSPMKTIDLTIFRHAKGHSSVNGSMCRVDQGNGGGSDWAKGQNIAVCGVGP